jgi:putative colanic acid biosynthesis acetyltransferase WcaF
MVWRILWMLAWPLFRFSPRPLFGWRRFLLRLFGAKVGPGVNVYPSTMIYFPWNLTAGEGSAIGENALVYNLGPVTLGERVTVSHQAHLCAGTHDYSRPDMPLQKPPVTVERDVWVCTGAFVGPGVTVGEGAVIGARAVAMSDVSAWAVVMGNPAEFVKERDLESP